MNPDFFNELKKLVVLQQKDSEIEILREELSAIPAEVEKYNLQLKELQQNLDTVKNEIKSIQLKIKQKELDIQTIEGQIKKHTQELNVVKTNEQYRALLTEIQKENSDKDKIETELLELMTNIDVLQQEIKNKEIEYNNHKKDIEDKIATLKSQQQQIEQQIQQKQKERNDYTTEINKKYLETYEHISSNRDISALSPVVENSCGICNMRLTQQEINDVSKYEEFIFCESCSRILYIPSDLEKQS